MEVSIELIRPSPYQPRLYLELGKKGETYDGIIRRILEKARECEKK